MGGYRFLLVGGTGDGNLYLVYELSRPTSAQRRGEAENLLRPANSQWEPAPAQRKDQAQQMKQRERTPTFQGVRRPTGIQESRS